MSLNAFLGDQSLGAWADEEADLPVASIGTTNMQGRETMDSKSSDKQWTKNAQFPTAPPYVLYMGNMDFNVTERDLQIFFGDLEIKNIRIIRDANDNPKGFGYVEFEELQGLKDALLLNNESLMGRKVRLDIAEQSSERKGFRDRTAESTNWRRDGPPPEREGNERKYNKPEGASNWRRDGPLPEREGSERKYDKAEGASHWRRDGPLPERERNERKYDKAEGASHWRRDGPLPEREGRKDSKKSFSQDATEGVSNWRRDGPPPEIQGRTQTDKRSFRDEKLDNESNWRRDGPVPDFKKERQGYMDDKTDRSDSRPSEGRNGLGQEKLPIHDKTEKVSNWRREAPLKDQSAEPNQKKSIRPDRSERHDRPVREREETQADSVDSWRSSGTPKPVSNSFKGLKHERSSASIKVVKANRTDAQEKTESLSQGNGPKPSVSVNNAFGCLSNED